MPRCHWIEKLCCPICQNIAEADLSTADEYSWDVKADSIPEGFKLVRTDGGSNFYCASCDVPVEP